MPEYLAPGVYVEEVPSGSKPIEGVSTSTAGMVGVTQRGPVNTPTLVTSFPEFTRRFGGYLDHRLFTGDRDVLPYAVEGFFVNGGQRLYVTRIVGANARYATTDLFGEPTANPASTALSERAPAGSNLLRIDDGTNISQGDSLLISDGARSEYVTAESDPTASGIRFFGSLHFDHASGDQVALQDPPTEGEQIPATGDMSAGGGLQLDTSGLGAPLAAGEVLRIQDTGDDTLTEFVTIATDGATDIVEPGLLFDHPAATTVVHRVTLADAGTVTTIDADATAGAPIASLADASGIAENGVVRIGTGATREFHVVRNVIADLSILSTPTEFIHSAGTTVIRQVPLLRVHARYQGQWGNELRIRIRRASQLETTVTNDVAQGDSPVVLDTIFGLNTGSVLEMPDGAGETVRERVTAVDPATNEVSFAGGVDVALSAGDEVSSVEFDLIIERIEDDRVVESEAFLNLAMDPEHPRYALNVVGAFDRNTGEPDPAGESELVRLSDLTIANDGTDVTDAPALRLSIPFAGVVRQCTGGDDDLPGIDDQTYIGTPSDDPDDRTGLYTLENIDDISIVAVPGRTSQDVQNAIVNHCELMRYRFAVLDSVRGARLADVQKQRQRYDTTRAALYYPYLTIRDLFGRDDAVLHIPPSGHVAGIYARSDVRRGVHKAPANEVVLGLLDVQVHLTKGEQDILNPKHVNCIRDFRDINRGIRVWGARTLSSDPEWKYVNVRRLFLFVEKSIERGTQWAVFEPNAEPLWAAIRRSVTNFLTAVWRDGALEGVKPEEAFFVKVDRTTMTQNDIDNGRLIILIGIAPVKPAEFVIFRISQKTREAVG